MGTTVDIKQATGDTLQMWINQARLLYVKFGAQVLRLPPVQLEPPASSGYECHHKTETGNTAKSYEGLPAELPLWVRICRS